MYFHVVMKQLIIPYGTNPDNQPKHSIDFSPWAEYPYKPGVSFSIVHDGKNIFLKYFVTEASIRAAAGNINGNVWEDSCVEFFIAFDDEGYYNIEMNCIGTMLIGYGKGRDHRVLLPEEKIKNIRYTVSIENNADGLIDWQLTATIPVNIFNITSLTGKKYAGNFYKCGDNLPQPHFLAWNNIRSDQPNFHLSQFFGDLFFE